MEADRNHTHHGPSIFPVFYSILELEPVFIEGHVITGRDRAELRTTFCSQEHLLEVTSLDVGLFVSCADAPWPSVSFKCTLHPKPTLTLDTGEKHSFWSPCAHSPLGYVLPMALQNRLGSSLGSTTKEQPLRLLVPQEVKSVVSWYLVEQFHHHSLVNGVLEDMFV